MKPISIVSNQPARFVRISYAPTDVCNFGCRYCFPESHAAKYRWPTNLELTVNNFKHLIAFYLSNGKEEVELQILGGEPTLWPELGAFINAVKTKQTKISIQSNGSRTLRWWEEHASLIDRVYLSAHHADINVEHFVNVADMLHSKGVTVDVNVCMDPFAWDQCINLIESFKQSKYKWFIGTQKIEELDGRNHYTDNQLEFLKDSVKRTPTILQSIKILLGNKSRNSVVHFDNGTKQTVKNNDVAINKWNHFYNWKCSIGLESFYIDPQGYLQGSCGEKLYGKDFLYNIYDTSFERNFMPDFVPATCTKVQCLCAPETLITKKL